MLSDTPKATLLPQVQRVDYAWSTTPAVTHATAKRERQPCARLQRPGQISAWRWLRPERPLSAPFPAQPDPHANWRVRFRTIDARSASTDRRFGGVKTPATFAKRVQPRAARPPIANPGARGLSREGIH